MLAGWHKVPLVPPDWPQTAGNVGLSGDPLQMQSWVQRHHTRLHVQLKTPLSLQRTEPARTWMNPKRS
jgi:hypothetical protein